MSVDTQSPAPGATARSTGPARIRRASFAVLGLVVVEYVIGMYVNLYVTVPKADHGSGLGGALSNGPAWLSVHAVIGLLLGLGGLGVLVQAIMIRHWPVTALSAAGLLSLVFAAVAGAGFTSTGDTSASMAMAVLTGVALACYAANVYVLRSSTGRE